MKFSVATLVSMILLLVSTPSFAASNPITPKANLVEGSQLIVTNPRDFLFSENGGMSGGGGDLLTPAEDADVWEIMANARTELILFFTQQTHHTNSAEIARLLNSSPNIIDVIRTVPIYSAYWHECKNARGETVAGSIISPEPNTICLNMMAFSRGLWKSEVRNQVLALAAHEYAHLLSFNETDARKLQEQVYSLVSFSSSPQITDMLQDLDFTFGSLVGTVILYDKIPAADKNWNALCFAGFHFNSTMGDVFDQSKVMGFNLFSLNEYKRFFSYRLKATAMMDGVCRLTRDYPGHAHSQLQHETWFRNLTHITAVDIGNAMGLHFDFLLPIPIRKIETVADFEAELKEVLVYVKSVKDYTFELKNFKDKESVPLF